MSASTSHSPPEEPNDLVEIGYRLQQVRLQKHLSLEVMAEKTLIRVSLLRAIEAGELLALPQPFYTKELIRKYADSLGLDGNYYADLYAKPDQANSSGKSSRSFRSVSMPSWRPFHLYFLYIAVVVVTVNTLSHWLRPSLPTAQINQIDSPITEISNANIETEATPLVVDITLKQQSWLEVVVDGKVVFQGDLVEGAHRTWMAENKLTIRAANAGGVLVEFNDSIQPLGESGKVQQVTYSVAQQKP